MPERSYSSTAVGYRYAFNGKELDPVGMGGGGSTYDYGFRIYNAQIGKFLSVDPLTKDYPWYTPYQFAGNMPIRYIDIDGLEPGEPYNSLGDAALNFASIYGKMSIQENREYSTAFYAFRDKDGEVKYTYAIPERGGRNTSPIVEPRDDEGPYLAGGHTHGAWKEKYIRNGVDENNVFSQQDKDISRLYSVPEILCNPAGQILGYIPSTNYSFVIDNNAPSDPNAQGIVNSNFAISQDKNFLGRLIERVKNNIENKNIRKQYEKRYEQLIKERKNENTATNEDIE